MTAPAPVRADLAELLALVDVSRSRAATAERSYLADVETLYGERELAVRSEDNDSFLTEALLLAVVALIRRAYIAGWTEGMRFASQQFEALGLDPDLTLPMDSGADLLVRDFLAGQAFVARSGGPMSELLRRAQLAVVSAVQMGRSHATEAAFAALTLADTLHKMWVARFDLTSPPCAECVRLHGTYVPLGSEFEVPPGSPQPYGGELHAPPRHPNCRCSLILYVPEWFDGDAESGPTPLSMQAYADWVLHSTEQDRSEMLAATVVRVGSYTRMVRGKLQHVDGYFYHVESGKVVSPAQARALGAGEIRTVSVQQAKAMRTQGKAPIGKAAGQATARRGSRAPGPGQQGLAIGGAPQKPAVSAAPNPRNPAADAQGTARRRVARDSQKQWPKGEYEIKMPSGQSTKVTIHANGSSTATSGDRTEKANARQTKLFLDFWDGQGNVTQLKGDPTPDEKEDSEKFGRDLDDPRPDPVRDADREAEWKGDEKKAAKAKPPEPEDDVAAKQEGVVQKGRTSLDPEKKSEGKKDEKKAEKSAAKAQKKEPEPEKSDESDAGSDEPNGDIKEMSAQELASEIAEVEDELRDMRRSGLSADDDEYREVRERLQALNAEEDSRTRPADAEPSGAESAAAEPEAKQAPQSVEKAKPAANKPAEKPAEKAPEKPASKPDEAATKEPEAAEQPAEKSAAKKPAREKKPAAAKAPRPAPLKVSEEDAARAPAQVPKVAREDATAGREMLRRAKGAEKVIQVAGDDGAAVASAMQLVNSTRHKHHVKVTDDSVRVSLKHIPVSNDGSRQYLVHSNGVVFERGIGPDGQETLTQMRSGDVERMVGPSFSGDSKLSLDDALQNVRKLTDEQLSSYMDESILADRIDDFDRLAGESNRREGQRNRTLAQHEARAAQIEALLDQGYGYGEAVEKVTGVSVDKQQRKMMIDALRGEGFSGVNLETLSKDAHKTYIYDMERRAEGPTAGYYITKDAERKGVDPLRMFYGTDEEREKYMSDELRDWFEENEYPKSLEDWKKSYLSQLVDTSVLGKTGTGEDATKTDVESRVDDLPPAPEPQRPRAFRGRNADGSEKTEEQFEAERPARPAPEPAPAPEPTPEPEPAPEPAPDPGQVLDDARDRVASELGISPEDAEEAVADALVDMAERGEDPYADVEALARNAIETRRAAATPDEPPGYKPTGRWQGGRLKSLSDEEIDAEKAAADKALTDAVAGGMRSSSPQMFDLRQAAKQFGEEQQKRREAASAEPEAAAEPEEPRGVVPPAPDLASPPEIDEGHADLLEMGDQELSAEWKAVQQDMRDMRANGVKTTDADYLENKARIAAIFAVMARRAQEGNREYIGGTPSRLEKLQELAKAIAQAPPGERAALEAQLIRVFRGEE